MLNLCIDYDIAYDCTAELLGFILYIFILLFLHEYDNNIPTKNYWHKQLSYRLHDKISNARIEDALTIF